jgi:uncharacterized protein (TIGR03905 family)
VHISYTPTGTCSRKIDVDIEAGVVTRCRFTKGCSGNLEGISRLIEGRRVEEIIPLLKGINCQNGTSCPDQLAHALEACLAQQRA